MIKILTVYIQSLVAVITMVPCQNSFFCSFAAASFRKVRECKDLVAYRGITFVFLFM